MRVFVRLRSLFGIEHDAEGNPTTWPDNLAAGLLSCVWCASIWAVFLLWGIWQWRWEPVMLLAASTIAIGAERWNRGSTN